MRMFDLQEIFFFVLFHLLIFKVINLRKRYQNCSKIKRFYFRLTVKVVFGSILLEYFSLIPLNWFCFSQPWIIEED